MPSSSEAQLIFALIKHATMPMAIKVAPGMSSDQQQGWKNTPQNPSQPNMNKDQDHTRGYPPLGQMHTAE